MSGKRIRQSVKIGSHVLLFKIEDFSIKLPVLTESNKNESEGIACVGNEKLLACGFWTMEKRMAVYKMKSDFKNEIVMTVFIGYHEVPMKQINFPISILPSLRE